MFNSLQHAVSGSSWSYLLILGVCLGDAMLPLLPSETVVVAGAVLAANGHLSIGLVAAAAAVGALAGDNAAYGVGRSGLSRLADRLFRSAKGRERLNWGSTQLRRHGAWIIIGARFIPGGRSATTYVAGTLAMPWRRQFLPADTVAALLWSAYATGLGYFGGAAFENNLWLPLVIAFGVSLLVAGAGELVRRRMVTSDSETRR